MLWSDLCDYSDAYIVVEGTITVTDAVENDRKNKTLALKNNAPLYALAYQRSMALWLAMQKT